MRVLRIVGLALIAVGIIATAGFAVIAHEPEIAAITPAGPETFDADLVAQGELLAGLGNCAVCHTTEGGAPYAGGLALPTPFGVIHSTNITPDLETGSVAGPSQLSFVQCGMVWTGRDSIFILPSLTTTLRVSVTKIWVRSTPIS